MSDSARVPVDPSGPTHARRLKVLFVAPSVPWPLDAGFAVRVFNLVRGVSTFHDTSLVAPAPCDEDGLEAVSAIASPVRLAPVTAAPSSLRSLAGLLRGTSRARQRQGTAALARAVEEAVDAVRPDVVQWETPFLASGCIGGALEILDEHNLWSELLERRCRFRRSPAKRALLSLDARAAAAEERRVWTRADATLFTSEREAQAARARGARRALVVPNGVDLERFAPAWGAGEPGNLLFMGLLSYDPNRDAMERFADEVLPRLLGCRPGVTLTLIGRDAPEWLVRRLGPRVRYLGCVPDVRPHLARAAVVIAPIRYGGGTRLKILESMAAGRPVVATSAAIEGLDVADPEHLLVADAPEAFADAIVRVLDDPALAQRLGQSARRLVERRYSWAQIASDLAVTYERLAAGRSGRAAHVRAS